MDNSQTPYIVSEDNINWRRITKNGWSTVTSQNPLRNGYISEITVLLVNTKDMLIGVGEKKYQYLYNHYIGGYAGSVAYYSNSGDRFQQTSQSKGGHGLYAPSAPVGSYVTLKVDLRDNRNTAEILINGRTQGYLYSGLGFSGDLYFGLSIYNVNHVVKIVDFKECKKK